MKQELDRLNKIFADVDPNRRDFVQKHIGQLAWYNVSIADLQAKVDQWGTLVSYDNGGGQTGIKPNPDVKTLLDYQKLCNTITRTLIPLVPDCGGESKLDEFMIGYSTSDDDDDPDPVDWAEKVKEIKQKYGK